MEAQLLKATQDESVEKAAPKTVFQGISTPIPLGSGSFDKESIKKAIDNRVIQRDYSIQGFNFNIEILESKVRIFHPKWSLVAEGSNLIQAEKKLIEEAKNVSEIYLEIPDNQLDNNAIEFKEFLFSIRDFG